MIALISLQNIYAIMCNLIVDFRYNNIIMFNILQIMLAQQQLQLKKTELLSDTKHVASKMAIDMSALSSQQCQL